MGDARVSAWVCAWKRLEAVDALIHKNPHVPQEMYRTFMDQAQVFADLASAPETVGFAAGEFLEGEPQREAKAREQMEEIFRGRP